MNEKVLVLGGGCFWCTEAFYTNIEGVTSVTSGYAGGKTINPSYDEVCGGQTGHAEVVSIHFNPDTVTRKELIDLFWLVHDPTTLNKQGHDVGSQYRSIIFYSTDEEKQVILDSIQTASKDFSKPIVTQVEPMETFYPAESSHQNFYAENPQYGYCQVVITPKMKKLGITTNKKFSISSLQNNGKE